MPDPAPRIRTAEAIMHDAADVLSDAQEWNASAGRASAHNGTPLSRVRQAVALIERLAAQVEDLAAVVHRIDVSIEPMLEEMDEAADDLFFGAVIAVIGSIDESWGLGPIVGRKMQGTDCTEAESIIVLGAFDRLPPSPARDALAEVFPMEFQQWSTEREAGDRPAGPHAEPPTGILTPPIMRSTDGVNHEWTNGCANEGCVQAVPTLTVGQLLAAFAGVEPSAYVTVMHDGWWLNVTGVHVPPFMPTECSQCGSRIEYRNGCWQDDDGYACPAVPVGDDHHVPVNAEREEPSVMIETADDFDNRQF